MDKLDEGRSRLIKSGGFFDEEFIIRLYMEMLVFMSCFGKTGGFRTLLLERRDCLATTRLMSLHVGKGQTAGDAVKRALGYIKDPTKTENGILVTSCGCTPQTAEAEFMLMRREYLTITGRRRGKDDVLQAGRDYVGGSESNWLRTGKTIYARQSCFHCGNPHQYFKCT